MMSSPPQRLVLGIGSWQTIGGAAIVAALAIASVRSAGHPAFDLFASRAVVPAETYFAVSSALDRFKNDVGKQEEII